MISVVIPAFNEERYLPETLSSVVRSATLLEQRHRLPVEILVVDNASTDATALVAASFGARLVFEAEHNISSVRNCGAKSASGDVLIFIDADTLIDEELLTRVFIVMNDSTCAGGAAVIQWKLQNRFLHWYFTSAANVARVAGLAQGATQFCRREIFQTLGGYDESLLMAEDADFYRRLRLYARRSGSHLRLITDLPVMPSARRYHRWPIWRTLVWTNPLVILLFCRTRSCWRGWYQDLIR